MNAPKMFREIFVLALVSAALASYHYEIIPGAFTNFNRTKEEVMQHKKYLTKNGFSYPGTKWCGPGNTAESDKDLGSKAEVDSCCRTHDHCPDHIPKLQTKHNLTNDLTFSMMPCVCDSDFYRCLKGIDNFDSNIIGFLYFNILPDRRCFANTPPIIKCVKKVGLLDERCALYELDDMEPNVYQWFDLPYF